MFKFVNTNHLADAVQTENHFLPILICTVLSLAILLAGNQFDTINDTPSTAPVGPSDNGTVRPHIDERETSIIFNLKYIRHYLSFWNIITFAVTTLCLPFILVFLVKRNCFNLISYWFSIAYFLVLAVFTGILMSIVFRENQFIIDLITVSIFLWNFSLIGVNCVLFTGPIFLYKTTLILVAAIFSSMLFIIFRQTICWILLAIITCWDFFAVLAPNGPLKKLAELSNDQDSGVLNAILYTSSSPKEIDNKRNQSKELLDEIREVRKKLEEDTSNSKKEADDIRRRWSAFDHALVEKLKLLYPEYAELFNTHFETESSIGLGDFVFFSLQIIIIADLTSNPFAIISVIISILTGLFVTIYILIYTSSALPALPIPILLSQVSMLTIYHLAQAKAEQMNSRLILI